MVWRCFDSVAVCLPLQRHHGGVDLPPHTPHRFPLYGRDRHLVVLKMKMERLLTQRRHKGGHARDIWAQRVLHIFDSRQKQVQWGRDLGWDPTQHALKVFGWLFGLAIGLWVVTWRDSEFSWVGDADGAGWDKEGEMARQESRLVLGAPPGAEAACLAPDGKPHERRFVQNSGGPRSVTAYQEQKLGLHTIRVHNSSVWPLPGLLVNPLRSTRLSLLPSEIFYWRCFQYIDHIERKFHPTSILLQNVTFSFNPRSMAFRPPSFWLLCKSNPLLYFSKNKIQV